jgi:hypothetical protein
MTNTITIGSSALSVIEHGNERVLTTQQLAKGYGTTAKRITDNFSRNPTRYKANKHFYCLEGNVLRSFKRETPNCGVAENTNKLYLWTELGTLLHAKSLNTDQAWDVYEKLVEYYFRAKPQPVKPTNTTAIKLIADQLEQHDDSIKTLDKRVTNHDKIIEHNATLLKHTRLDQDFLFRTTSEHENKLRHLDERADDMELTQGNFADYVKEELDELIDKAANNKYDIGLVGLAVDIVDNRLRTVEDEVDAKPVSSFIYTPQSNTSDTPSPNIAKGNTHRLLYQTRLNEAIRHIYYNHEQLGIDRWGLDMIMNVSSPGFSTIADVREQADRYERTKGKGCFDFNLACYEFMKVYDGVEGVVFV